MAAQPQGGAAASAPATTQASAAASPKAAAAAGAAPGGKTGLMKSWLGFGRGRAGPVAAAPAPPAAAAPSRAAPAAAPPAKAATLHSRLARLARWGKWSAIAAVVGFLALLVSPYRDLFINWWEARQGYRPLLGVVTWHYQLDKIEPALPLLTKNTADMLVIDHAKRGGTVGLTREEVEALKVRRDGRRRLVIAYMSIGEAEEFRFYWNKDWKVAPPVWLGEENCAWPQAHRVRFWNDDWKALSFRGPSAFLKRIADAGFDGVYLDRIDIYETFDKERPTARAEMVQFVSELSAVAKQLKPGFLVIAQNAEDLLTERAFRRAIDGLAKESLLHGGAGTTAGTGVRNKPEDIAWSRSRLNLLLAERKPVFNVEYLVDMEQIDATRHELIMAGLVPTFPTRSLDGEEPTLPRDLAKEVGTPERTLAACKPGTAW